MFFNNKKNIGAFTYYILLKSSMKKLRFFFFVSVYFLLASCSHDELTPVSNFETICFENQILPVFQTGCAISGCHSSQSEEGGYLFSDYAGIVRAISPGDPYSSKAYLSIIASGGEHAMPPDRPLPEAERTLIRIWIEQGAMNTTCSDTGGGVVIPKDTSTCFTGEVLPILLSSCSTTDCHDAGSHKEGIVLDSYESIFTYGEESMVVTGNPEGSKLYKVLNASGEERMPPSPYSPLTEAQKQTIYDWIKEGAENTDCIDSCDPAVFTFQLAISTMIENNCRGCHSSSFPNGNIKLESYSDIKAIADNGSLIDVVYGQNGKPLMPPANQLSSCEIQQLENWIADGSLNN